MKSKEEMKLVESEGADKVRNFFKELLPYLAIIVIVALIRTFLVTPVRVTGASMDPYLKDGDILLENKTAKEYKRFDIVVIDAVNTKIIKRIIGMPGENIEYKDCKLYINNEEMKDFVTECITDDFSLEGLYNYLTIPEGYYFVMGDNRRGSSDSRDSRIGLIKEDQIDGRTSVRIWPFNKFGNLK
jgi:signal peptidase I